MGAIHSRQHRYIDGNPQATERTSILNSLPHSELLYKGESNHLIDCSSRCNIAMVLFDQQGSMTHENLHPYELGFVSAPFLLAL